jgi:hypothetical protein
MTTESESGIRLHLEENKAPPRTILLEYFDVVASRSEGELIFDNVKEQINLSPLEIGNSLKEKFMYFKFRTSTMNIMAHISTTIDELRDKHDKTDREKELVDEYDGLDGEMASCNQVIIKAIQSDAGGVIEFDIQTWVTVRTEYEINGKKKYKMVPEQVPNGNIKCSPDQYLRGVELAEENGYRRLNCTAGYNFYKALKMAVRCKFISKTDVTKIKASGPKTEDFLGGRK